MPPQPGWRFYSALLCRPPRSSHAGPKCSSSSRCTWWRSAR
jgi:hypothetical protein